jgi:hypothetical protein
MKLANLPSLFLRPGLAFALGLALCIFGSATTSHAAESKDAGGSIKIEGHFPGTKTEEKEPKLIYSIAFKSQIFLSEKGSTQRDWITVTRHQGRMEELNLGLSGNGDIVKVQGAALLTSGVMKNTKNRRSILLRIKPEQQTNSSWNFEIESRLAFKKLPASISPIGYTISGAITRTGSMRIEPTAPRITVGVAKRDGLTTMDPKDFTPVVKGKLVAGTDEQVAFHYSGAPWHLTLNIKEADPDLRKIRLNDFQLTGEISGDTASFKLTGLVKVNHPDGGEMDLMGAVAMKKFAEYPNVSLRWNGSRYLLHFSRNGEFPIDMEFDAQIADSGTLKRIQFYPPAAALRPVTIKGLPAGTQIHLSGAAEPERQGDAFVSHLAPSGPLTIQWQPAREEIEGKLFYSVNGLVQIAVSPGLIRQTQAMDYQVMQGEMQSLSLKLFGQGEVTRVHCDGILTWKVDPTDDANVRTLTVQLNQPQTKGLALTIQSEQALGVFPTNAKPMRAVPEAAIRYGGHLRVVNSGAVRLEIINAPGLVQVSPQRFPQSQIIGGLSAQQKPQAFRFSGSDFDLELRADNILPELTVSEVLIYHLGETESRIEAELELEIREAPLREFAIQIPGGYSVAQLSIPNLGNYDVEPGANNTAELRLQFTQPLIGRQVLGFRLTRNHNAPPAAWPLPAVRPLQVKSVRGFIGVSADAGLRLAETQVSGLTEIATAFFPRQIKELQLAWRIRDANWQSTIASERLALSIQADALHLYSVGEGIVFGSTVLNYLISGAPVSSLTVAAPTNYANVEFTGREVRNWKPTANGYEVELHNPISGAYTLLATYDLQFDPKGAELDFNGIEPLGVQSEQGYVIVVSQSQFTTVPAPLSPGLIKLETGEIPTEYRLLFDAPILAAYQYTGRPFLVRLKMTSLTEGSAVRQVVDRATFTTQISSEGEAQTVAHYYIKSTGHSHLRISVPSSARLRTATINDKKAVLGNDGKDPNTKLVPLPQNVGPNTVIPLKLVFTQSADDPEAIALTMPKVDASILLAEWNIQPDPGYRLIHRSSKASPEPQNQSADISGFAWVSRLLDGYWPGRESMPLILAFLLLLAAALWHWGTGEGVHRFDGKNVLGVTGGAIVGAVALGMLIFLIGFSTNRLEPSIGLAYTIPVQTPDNLISVTLQNGEIDAIGYSWLNAWPVLLGLFAWFYALGREADFGRHMLVAAGWACHCWAALRLANGAPMFFIIVLVFVFFHLALPLIRRQLDLPIRPDDPDPDPEPGEPKEPSDTPPSSATAAGAAALLILSQLMAPSDALAASGDQPPPVPSLVRQQANVVKNDVFISAKMEWQPREGDRIDFLHAPAVLTQISFSTNSVKLVQETVSKRTFYQLQAIHPGKVVIDFKYQIPVENKKSVLGFTLPNRFGLINELTLDLDRADVEIVAANVVSVRPLKSDPGKSRFALALAPTEKTRVEWKPRSRDTREEKTVFFAELRQLFIPTAGVIEGLHDAQIRPAQGQVSQLTFTTPPQMTITDVRANALASWRFDPDTRKLRVEFSPAQSKPFAVRVNSQISTSPLPYQREIGLISVEEDAREIGLVGVATGSDVQLSAATAAALSRINLEDFPADLIAEAGKQISGLTLRRSFRYSDTAATVSLSADAVEPDVRVSSQQNLLLSEDRTVLGVNLSVSITRAGVFKLSFALPDGMDVESLTGKTLSHWTELAANNQRIVTLHLKGKTEGQADFAISLVGPGTAGAVAIQAPRLSLIEAGKQTGQLIVSPEQGMRLQESTSEGLTQLDPKRAGITQQGALAFRLLQADWSLNFDVEKVTPWIEAATLQDVTVREGPLKTVVHLNYKISHAGLKSLFVELPANAESVHFVGEHVADFVKDENAAGDTAQWEIKLHRRVIDSYRLKASYQISAANQPEQHIIVGVLANQINLQRSYLTVRTGGRLQVTPARIPTELRRADWPSVPTEIRRESGKTGGSLTFQANQPAYRLTVNVARHSAAELLPSRVEDVELSSLLSDSGMMLTKVKLTLHPGDRRFIRFKLPTVGAEKAKFWFAFVDNLSARPWNESEFILIPFESPSKKGDPVKIEFLYSIQTALKKSGKFDLNLPGPVFELPLQNISWNVFLPPTWKLEEEDEAMRLQQTTASSASSALDVHNYVQSQSAQQKQKTSIAESMLAWGNQSLDSGDQSGARRAFKSALNLSQHDQAFNEDARVQLHNLKLQQAVVGLNNRANYAFVDQPDAAGNTIAIQKEGKELYYTDKQVREALNRNPAEANEALMKLAEQLVEQQNAAQANPEAIQAALPEYGQRLTFTRSMLVDENSKNLKLDLEVSEVSKSTYGRRLMQLAGIVIAFAILMALGKRRPDEFQTF